MAKPWIVAAARRDCAARQRPRRPPPPPAAAAAAATATAAAAAATAAAAAAAAAAVLAMERIGADVADRGLQRIGLLRVALRLGPSAAARCRRRRSRCPRRSRAAEAARVLHEALVEGLLQRIGDRGSGRSRRRRRRRLAVARAVGSALRRWLARSERASSLRRGPAADCGCGRSPCAAAFVAGRCGPRSSRRVAAALRRRARRCAAPSRRRLARRRIARTSASSRSTQTPRFRPRGSTTRAVADADQPADRQADRVEQLAHLAVAAFGDDDAVPVVGAFAAAVLDRLERGALAVDLDAFEQLRALPRRRACPARAPRTRARRRSADASAGWPGRPSW